MVDGEGGRGTWAWAAAALLLLGGCGGPGKDAPRFWYDEASRQRLPDHYALPDDPGAPDNTGEYLARPGDRRRARDFMDDYGYGYAAEDDGTYREVYPAPSVGPERPDYRLGDDYQGRDTGRDADYRDQRWYEADGYGYEMPNDPQRQVRPRVRPAR